MAWSDAMHQIFQLATGPASRVYCTGHQRPVTITLIGNSGFSMRDTSASGSHWLDRFSGKIMRVEKWYLDCVTADGAGMIGYAVRMRVGPLALRCSEALLWRAGNPADMNRVMPGGRLPTEMPDGIVWRSRAIDAKGRWCPCGLGIPTVILYEEAAGRIEWKCFCPAAQTMVSVGSNHLEGLGYVERLVITLPLAKLPIRELRWGRFIAGEQNCVWIQWRGPIERGWCYHNGRAVDAVMPDPHELVWNGHRLRLDQGTTLRTGCVLETAFKDAGWLRWLLPRAVRGIEETKWCSAGVLTDEHGHEHAGWAIHEVAIIP